MFTYKSGDGPLPKRDQLLSFMDGNATITKKRQRVVSPELSSFEGTFSNTIKPRKLAPLPPLAATSAKLNKKQTIIKSRNLDTGKAYLQR